MDFEYVGKFQRCHTGFVPMNSDEPSCICGDHCLDFGGCGEWHEDEGQNPPFTNVMRCGRCGCACGDA